MLRLDLRLLIVRTRGIPSSRVIRVYRLGVSSTAARDSLQIDRPRLLNGGLHLEFGLLQWLKFVENQKTQNETKNNPQPKVCTSLSDSNFTYNSSPKATTAREIEAGVCAPGSSRRLPETTHEVFSCTREVASQQHKNVKNLRMFLFARLSLLIVPWPIGTKDLPGIRCRVDARRHFSKNYKTTWA